MNKKETILTVCLGVFVVIGLVLIWKKDKENNILKADLRKTKKDNLILLDEYLKLHNQTMPDSIKKMIIRLKDQYKGIDPKIEAELQDIEDLIVAGKDEIALRSLAKIVEDILRQELSEDLKKKRTAFDKLLDMARKRNIISETIYNIGKEVKEVRNKLTHELGVRLDDETKVSMFVGCISIIYALKGIPNE